MHILLHIKSVPPYVALGSLLQCTAFPPEPSMDSWRGPLVLLWPDLWCSIPSGGVHPFMYITWMLVVLRCSDVSINECHEYCTEESRDEMHAGRVLLRLKVEFCVRLYIAAR